MRAFIWVLRCCIASYVCMYVYATHFFSFVLLLRHLSTTCWCSVVQRRVLAITITSSRDYLTVWSVDNAWTTFVGLGQHHWYSFQDGGYTSAAKYVTGFQSSIGTMVRVFCSSHVHESFYMGTSLLYCLVCVYTFFNLRILK